MNERIDPRVVALSTLVQLAQEARQAESLDAFAFVVANSLKRLIPFQSAAFWADRTSRCGLVALSGVAEIDADSPAMIWLDTLCRHLATNSTISGPRVVSAADIPDPLGAQWREWGPVSALWLPLRHPSRQVTLGGLWIGRDAPFSGAELALLERLAEALGETLSRHLRVGSTRSAIIGLLSRRRLAIAAGLLLIALFPVRMSVTAPAEIAARDPIVLAAPRDGVVSRFHVRPNQAVREGDKLFDLDDVDVRNRHQLAVRDLAIVQADYKRASQAAFADSQSSAELALLATRIERAKAEEAYSRELLSRSEVMAEQDGLVVFTDPADWVGKPVRTGERIALLSNPNRVEVLAWLASTDAIVVRPGAAVRMFLNTAPFSPVEAVLDSASYEAQMSPAGVLSYRLKASIPEVKTPPRIGLHGSARVYADRVPLIAWILRKPLATFRQLIGV
jgi:multidrug resistance efflux pump